MKIKILTGSGIKGREFEHKLEDFNVIVGDNAAGKTARLDAIQLALSGAHRLGRKSEAIMRLADGTTMSAGLTFDDGSYVKRTWTYVGGSIKALTDSKDFSEVPAVIVNPSEYFGLSPYEKTMLAFRLCKLDEQSITEIHSIADVKNLGSPQAWLEHRVETLKSKKNELKLRMQKLQSGAQMLMSKQTVTRPLAEIEADLKAARKDYDPKGAESYRKIMANLTIAKEKAAMLEKQLSELKDTCHACGRKLTKKAVKEAAVAIQNKLDIELDYVQVLNKTNLPAADHAMELRIDELEEEREKALISHAQAKASELAGITKAAMEKELAEVEPALAQAQKVMDDILKVSFENVLKIANQIAKGPMGYDLVYLDGHIGYYKDGNFIRNDTFSGSETLISHTAISIALASQHPLKLVMMDEVGRCSEKTRVEVYSSLKDALKEGIISQVVLVDVNDVWKGVDGVNVISV